MNLNISLTSSSYGVKPVVLQKLDEYVTCLRKLCQLAYI